MNCYYHKSFFVQEFEEECLKLQSVVGTLEGNIKSLLKDYDSKKKVHCLLCLTSYNIRRKPEEGQACNFVQV